MEDINQVVVSGRLTRDPELKYTAGGTALLHMSIASNTRKKKGDSWEDYPNFIDCTIFGKPAEWGGRDLAKGSKVTLVGRFEQQRWEKDGMKASKVVIIAESLHYERKGAGGEPEMTAIATKEFTDDIPF